MPFVLGENCELILRHADAIAGEPLGFFLVRNEAQGIIKIDRSFAGLTETIEIEFTVLIGKAQLLTPESETPIPIDETYDYLFAVLKEQTAIELSFSPQLGVFTEFVGLHLDGQVVENHRADGMIFITVKLSK